MTAAKLVTAMLSSLTLNSRASSPYDHPGLYFPGPFTLSLFSTTLLQFFSSQTTFSLPSTLCCNDLASNFTEKAEAIAATHQY